MKKIILMALIAIATVARGADTQTVTSPEGNLKVNINVDQGKASYEVWLDGRQLVTPSTLGFVADIGDFTQGLRLDGTRTSKVDKSYTMEQAKASHIHYAANQLDLDFVNAEGGRMTVTFLVSANDVAYRYTVPRQKNDNPKCAVILREESAFNFPSQTTTFLCPQIGPFEGWERTKPSYEEEYTADAPMTKKSRFGLGYTFPCLFRIGDEGWVLVGETGVGSNYCGSRLSDYESGKGYTITFPEQGEFNGIGSVFPGIPLPGNTPWRTLTLGTTLKPIVETTIPYDVVEPLYERTSAFNAGRYTWSWLIWQDNSINYNDQVKFIDLASEMGFEMCLVDNWWDNNIGRERMAELSRYAQSKGVKLMLWYNSNGFWNDAPQTPRDCMSTSIAREKEMKWLKSIGVAGIKVDFFGSDKQETMRFYEDILSDANRYGLQVIFHGCTIPRGWERMYPNYVASEAALASENLVFNQHHCDNEGFELTMHPFSRNALGALDWGGIIMNRRMSKDNNSRNYRRSSDTFEMATGIVLQTAVNCVAMQPNNLSELPQFELDFLRQLPTTWDETRFIDGYPTRYAVLARRHGDNWYVAGINGTKQPLTLTLDLPMMAGKTVSYYTDKPAAKVENAIPEAELRTLKVDKKGKAKVTIQPMGGIILK
ncbi:MAG: glycoside hydrolase family 97 catalytic domain-containing protein [Prevotella sp.]|nr:glycoside hydrolase family 97 catalytic domain-containing protein [Prevotella sp.]